MKYSIGLLALGASSISALAFPAPNAQSSNSCDAVSLGECAQPLTQKVLDCGNADLECLCTTVSELVGCYDQFCPGQAPAEVGQAIDACNSEGQTVADPSGGTGGSLDDFSATSSNGLGEPTSTGLGLDDLASETGSGGQGTKTETLVDPESIETTVARVTKTTSAEDDSEETSSTEPEQNDSISEETDAPKTSTRRATPTQSPPASTQSGAAAENFVAPVGGLLAAAIGVVALL